MPIQTEGMIQILLNKILNLKVESALKCIIHATKAQSIASNEKDYHGTDGTVGHICRWNSTNKNVWSHYWHPYLRR
jgi:hypothetical protein